MTDTPNPYTPPVSSLQTETGPCRLDGETVVLKAGGDLPHRCVKCNAPSVEALKPTKLSWHHPAWYLTFLITPILYFVTYFLVRKSARVTVGLCPTHYGRRRFIVITTFAGLFISLWMVITGNTSDGRSELTVLGVCLMIVIGLVGAAASSTGIRATEITPEEIRLKGFGKAFRQGLASPVMESVRAK